MTTRHIYAPSHLTAFDEALLLLDVSMEMRQQKEESKRQARYTEKQMEQLWNLAILPHSVFTLHIAESIKKNTILYFMGGQHLPFIVITHKDVRRWYAEWDSYSSVTYIECLLYSFDTPLGIKEINMLDQVVWPMTQPLCIPSRLIVSSHPNDKELCALEHAIRSIPGTDVCGDWKQLNGFFGIYYNETTTLLSPFPPAI